MNYRISEVMIRNAIDCCTNARECAEYLNVSYSTFKKYAKQYYDNENKMTLLELAKYAGGKTPGDKVRSRRQFKPRSDDNIEKIYSGSAINWLSPNKLKNELINAALLPEECSNCGYSEKRIIDFATPLVLDFIDNDRRNGKSDNVRLLCYNCYFQIVGNMKVVKTKLKISDEMIDLYTDLHDAEIFNY